MHDGGPTRMSFDRPLKPQRLPDGGERAASGAADRPRRRVARIAAVAAIIVLVMFVLIGIALFMEGPDGFAP